MSSRLDKDSAVRKLEHPVEEIKEVKRIVLEKLPKNLRRRAAKLLLKIEGKFRINDDGQIVYPNGEIGSDLPFLFVWHYASEKRRSEIERPWDYKIFRDYIEDYDKEWVKLFK